MKIKTKTYDRETQEPMIKASICNGEQVAGFRDKKPAGSKKSCLSESRQILKHSRRNMA